MPEQLKPCPACGSEHTVVAKNFSPWFTAGSHVLCIDCQMQGPIACSQREEDAITIEDLREMIEPTGFESAAIAAWNRLPRALTWTHEPPKVTGLYMLRAVLTALGDGPYGPIQILNITQDMLVYSHRKDFQWAGPIPAPID